ncbi:hypothetical protein H4W33_002738 [Kibdelosporangium phytohabitans]|nr:hypothetical protein [Kibdelosporangium phytohabitans]
MSTSDHGGTFAEVSVIVCSTSRERRKQLAERIFTSCTS